MSIKNILLLVVIVVSLFVSAFTYFGWGNSAKAKRRDLANELAMVVAKEASANGEKGSLLILSPMDDKADPFPSALGNRLATHMGAAGFAPVVSVKVPYNTAIEGTGEPVTREVFLALLKEHADVKVVVSLVGVPKLTASDLPANARPRLIVASTIIMPYLATLPRGLIDFAIEVKRDAVTDERTSSELGELSRYFVLTRMPR